MKKAILYGFYLAVAACTLAAQPLRSSGPLPADLRQSVQQLYDTDVARAKQYAGGRVRDKQALLEASYRINKLLASGHIVYGDPISRMVGRMADTLLKDYPVLRSELRFYTVTSPEVNAFTTPQGMIFVNAGLVAQVENEAQLAFVVAHEIIHYYRAHGLETLVGRDGKKKRSKNLDDEAERAADILSRHLRSHEMENEADSLGIALFYKGSPYWKDVTEGVFDVLQYSQLPFDDIAFDTTVFNTPYYRLTGCWLDTVAPITARDNYDDSRSTHPNILSRRQRTARAMAGMAGGRKYVVTTPTEFDSLRHLARLECIRQDLINGNFARALYNSWLLLRLSPGDATLTRYYAQALYGAAVFKCHEKYTAHVTDYSKIEGEGQQAYCALQQMTAEQAVLAALHTVWPLHRADRRNAEYAYMADHLMRLLRTHCQKASGDFLDTPPVAVADTVAADDTAEAAKPMTKYERIKQKRKTQTRQNPTAYALTDLLMADSTLGVALKDNLDGRKEPATASLEGDTSAMLVFNPSYWVTNSDDELRTARSTAAEDDLLTRIMGTADHLGRRTVDFSDQGMHDMVTDQQYNDFLTVCEWMNEFWLTKGSFEAQRLLQPVMDNLLARYDARTLTMASVLNVEGLEGTTSLGYFYLVPLLPIIVAGAFTGTENTTMVCIVVDAHEGRMITRQAYSYNAADHSGLVDAMLYDTYVRTGDTTRREPVGHLGHRFALAGGASVGLSGYQPLEYKHYVALTPWASAEFAVGRKASLTLTARYQKAYDDIVFSGHRQIFDDRGFRWQDTTFCSSRNMLTAGLDVRLYSNTHFAPLGQYIDVGAHWVRFTSLDGSPYGNTFGLHAGLGRNYIVMRRLLLNYEIDYAYTYGLSRQNTEYGYEADRYHYLDALLSNVITIKLGIGFLPF